MHQEGAGSSARGQRFTVAFPVGARAKRRRDSARVDVAALSRYFSAILRGMSVEASGGATRQDLQNVIDLSLKVWPT